MEGVSSELATDLRYVRSEALARQIGVRLSLQSSSTGSCYVVHTGTAAGCRCLEPGGTHCDEGAEELKT
ncbi:MAG: fimbrial assembly protein, partial [Rhizobacter sp.]|nr:fimbrial assembly protein [Rhizobacter sp.]